MGEYLPTATLVLSFAVLTLVQIIRLVIRRRFLFDSYLEFTWLFFASFVVSTLVSFAVAIWVLALISFWAIREYFSLIDIRLQDRLGILGAYLSIPFMYYFIQIDWYGMFIVSIPVYAFLAVPFLVALGGNEAKGAVFSIGAIDFGLFLFVFCIGHIGYLLLYSSWNAALLIINVLISDAAVCFARRKMKTILSRLLAAYVVAAPGTAGVSLALANWTEVPAAHSLILAAMTPVLVMMGHHTGDYLEADMGIEEDLLTPGRGQILDNLQSLFYAAPVTFHYIRYFLK